VSHMPDFATQCATHSENVVRIYFSVHRLFSSKNSKMTTFPVYFEIVMPIDGDPDGKILRSSRLESIGSLSDRFKAVHSRSIYPRLLECKRLERCANTNTICTMYSDSCIVIHVPWLSHTLMTLRVSAVRWRHRHLVFNQVGVGRGFFPL